MTIIRQTLESVGIPVSLSSKIDVILQHEIENPNYQRSLEEQEIISHGWIWWVAQGQRTLNHKGGY